MTEQDLFTQAPEAVNKPKFDIDAYLVDRNKVLRELYPDDLDLIEKTK